MTFGERLKELRLSKDMTQSDLAKRINLSKANVSKYEANFVEPNLETLGLIAKVFNVSVDYLLGYTNEISPTRKVDKDLIDAQIATFGDPREYNDTELEEIKSFVKSIKAKRTERDYTK